MQEEQKIRYFKCIYDNKEFGRYCGRTPKQAASKALTSIIKSNGGNNECVDKKFNFVLRECTRGYKSKEKKYEGSRVKLNDPIIVKISNKINSDKDKTITYKFLNKIKYVHN